MSHKSVDSSKCSEKCKNVVSSSAASSINNVKSGRKSRKVIPSQKLQSPKHDVVSSSLGKINNTRKPTKPKNITKSEPVVDKGISQVIRPVDRHNASGDHRKSCQPTFKITEKRNKAIPGDQTKRIPLSNVESVQPVHQYYKNEKFMFSSESLNAHEKKISNRKTLSIISEKTENKANEFKEDNSDIFLIENTSTDREATDYENIEVIKNINQFRNEHYFECHSSKSKGRSEFGNLKKHKCTYRFYLNDRLFPVPLCTDYKNTIRCVECHLPLSDNTTDDDDHINAAIQAKVKMGDSEETQDLLLFLPVKEPLLFKENRMEKSKIPDDVVYFGVVKLDATGNSIFNRTNPQDSLALRHQKGYKQFDVDTKYEYDRLEITDVIRI